MTDDGHYKVPKDILCEIFRGADKLDDMAPKNGRKFQAVSFARQQPGLLFRHSRRSHNRSNVTLSRNSKKGF